MENERENEVWLERSHVMEGCQQKERLQVCTWLSELFLQDLCVCVFFLFIRQSRGLQWLIGCLDVYFSMHVRTGRCADGLKLKENCPTLCWFLSLPLTSFLWALYRCCSLNLNPTTSSKFCRGCSRSFQAVPRTVRGTLLAACAAPLWAIQATSAGLVTVQ